MDDLLVKDWLSSRKHTRIILWVVIIGLWLSMRNMAMTVVSAVLFVLDGVVLPFHLLRLSDELQEQVSNLRGLLRFLEILGYMLLGAAVWARFF